MTAFQPFPTGAMLPWAGYWAKVPAGWLGCDGSAVSRTTYSSLFSVICPELGTASITIASPGVVTITIVGGGSSIYLTGDAVFLTTTGSLPTGLTANTVYYIIYDTTNTVWLATSRANAYSGTKINTSGSQSGTHTIWFSPFGIGDGSTTFNVPDSRGRTVAGMDSGQGNLNLAQSQGSYGNAGATGGEQGHTLTSPGEIPSHSHGAGGSGTSFIGGGSGAAANITTGGGSYVSNTTTGTTGSSGAHNNVQPTLVSSLFIIKT